MFRQEQAEQKFCSLRYAAAVLSSICLLSHRKTPPVRDGVVFHCLSQGEHIIIIVSGFVFCLFRARYIPFLRSVPEEGNSGFGIDS